MAHIQKTLDNKFNVVFTNFYSMKEATEFIKKVKESGIEGGRCSKMGYFKTQMESEEKMKTEKVKTIDAKNYVGEKTKVALAEVVNLKFGLCLRVTSEDIPFKKGDSLPDNKPLRASKLISFSQNDDGEYILPEGGKGEKWLKDHGVESLEGLEAKEGATFNELIGKECVVQKNDDNFLDLA